MRRNLKIDIKKVLKDKNIQFWETGKNIMKNFVGVKCWQCGDDPSHHLNFREDGWFALCFRCGLKLSGVKNVLEFIFGRSLSNKEFLKYVRFYKFDGIETKNIKFKKPKTLSDIESEWNAFSELRDVDLKYLESRDIYEEFARKWGLRGGVGNYLYYVMIGVRNRHGELVGFIGRDTTGKCSKKFLNSSNVNLHRYLFGAYECEQFLGDRGYVVIVEGIFDVLKAQQNGIICVGLMGKIMSDGQLEELLDMYSRNIKIFILLDKDARAEAMELAEILSHYYDFVKVIELKRFKDIGEMKNDDIKRLKEFFEADVKFEESAVL